MIAEEISRDLTLFERAFHTTHEHPGVEAWRRWWVNNVLKKPTKISVVYAVAQIASYDLNSVFNVADLVEIPEDLRFTSRRPLTELYNRTRSVVGQIDALMQGLVLYGVTPSVVDYMQSQIEQPEIPAYMSTLAQSVLLATAFRQGQSHPILGQTSVDVFAQRVKPIVDPVESNVETAHRFSSAITLEASGYVVDDATQGQYAMLQDATRLWDMHQTQEEITAQGVRDVIQDSRLVWDDPVTVGASTGDSSVGTGINVAADNEGSAWLVEASSGLFIVMQVNTPGWSGDLLEIEFSNGVRVTVTPDSSKRLNVLTQNANGDSLGSATSISSFEVESPEKLGVQLDPEDNAILISINGSTQPAGAYVGPDVLSQGKLRVAPGWEGTIGNLTLGENVVLTQGELDAYTA